MIGLTLSGKAYATIAAKLQAGSVAGQEIAPDREYLVWVPRAVVNRLRALRGPGETFSSVILRLKEPSCFAAQPPARGQDALGPQSGATP